MKIFAFLLLAVAYVHTNSTFYYGWTPGLETVFRFESHVLTGIPDISNSQYAGMKLHAKVRVQAFQDYTLRVKLEESRFITLNGEISLTEARRIVGDGGARSGHEERFPQEFRRHLEEPFLVHLKRGLVENFFVSQNEPVAITNIKRSVLAQLQLDVSASQRTELDTNMIDIGNRAQLSGEVSYFKTSEECLHGKCETLYNIYHLPESRALELEQSWEEEEKRAQLPPSQGGKAACSGKKYFEIVKTRDFDSCTFSPVAQRFVGGEGNADVTKSHAGNLMTHMASSTAYVCGELSAFHVRKVVVDDVFVTTPLGYNTKEKLRSTTRILIELLQKTPTSAQIQVPPNPSTRKETSLVYAYPGQETYRNQMSEEIVRQTQAILGTSPVYPQPGLADAPKAFVPNLNVNKQEVMKQIVEQLTKLAHEIAESPESCNSNTDISGQMLAISKYLRELSLQQLEEVSTQVLSKVSGPTKLAADILLHDIVAMAGTNPSTMFIIKKIETGHIPPQKAIEVIQSAMRSILTPTKELLGEFVKLIRKLKGQANTPEKKQLFDAATLQLSNVFYHAYVNPSTMVTNFPVRIFGVFGTKETRVLVDEYIPFLKEMLEEGKQSNNKQLQLVVISALGKLGHLGALPHLLKVVEGKVSKQPMMRSFALYSMKRIVRRYPTESRAVLLAIINNPAENADVRIAAIAVLPWAQPTFADLQMIAVRSWYDPSRQVSSFARSTGLSLLNTEVPELKAVGMKVRGMLHMFKPTPYGYQFSHNVHVSKFVEYLMGAVSTKVEKLESKFDLIPRKVGVSTNLYLEAMGSGIMLNLHSFAAYSQGTDAVIDKALKYIGGITKANEHVRSQLTKIAQELQLAPRTPVTPMAFVHRKVLGYEYPSFVEEADISRIMEKISGALDRLMAGVSGQHASGLNMASFEVLGMTEAGLPHFARVDIPAFFAVKAQAQAPNGIRGGVNAQVIPLFHAKVQSDFGIVCPFTEEVIAAGVTMSLHSMVPLEAKISAQQGEVNIVVKTPEQIVRNGKSLEIVHGFVRPYTVRKNVKTILPINKASSAKTIVTGKPLKRVDRTFNQGGINGEFHAETDAEYVDFYSYWEKIKQHNVISLFALGPLMSSVRRSSTKFLLNPALSEIKEVELNIGLYARNPNYIAKYLAKELTQAQEKEVESKGFHSLKKALAELQGPSSSAILIKFGASLKGPSTPRKFEAMSVIGYKAISEYHTKHIFSGAARSFQGQPLGFSIEGDALVPKMEARWTKDDILNQPLEVSYQGKFAYGPEADPSSRKTIIISSKIAKTEAQKAAVRQSPEFQKCTYEESQGRFLSPICIKARHQAGSLNNVMVALKASREMPSSYIFRTIEELLRAKYAPHYKQISPATPVEPGMFKVEIDLSRTGETAQVLVQRHSFAYQLQNLRVPRHIQGVMPFSIRNSVGSWLEQKASFNRAPASCRIEPKLVTTFDNRNYAYTINDCEHVLMMDSATKVPVAVLGRTMAGGKKAVRILSGVSEIEIIPESGSLTAKVNGRTVNINKGATFYEKCSRTGDVIVEIKHYKDDVFYVYVRSQLLRVLTDGQRIEVVAPQLLKGRAVGLCGDLNGESEADVKSPQECVMEAKFAAMSYILNKPGSGGASVGPKCAGLPARYRPEYERQKRECAKERTIPTPVSAMFDRFESLNKPVVSAHMVEKKRNQICLSKQKIKICSGQSIDNRAHGTTRRMPLSLKSKLVEYVCISRPTSKAASLEKRARSGETLSMELNQFSTSYSKVEFEPVRCVSAKSSSGMSGGGSGSWLSEEAIPEA